MKTLCWVLTSGLLFFWVGCSESGTSPSSQTTSGGSVSTGGATPGGAGEAGRPGLPGEGPGGGGSANEGGTGPCGSAANAAQCVARGCFPVTLQPWLRIDGNGAAGGAGQASACREEEQDEEYVGCAIGNGGAMGVCYCRRENDRSCALGGVEVEWVSDDWVTASCDSVGCNRFD